MALIQGRGVGTRETGMEDRGALEGAAVSLLVQSWGGLGTRTGVCLSSSAGVWRGQGGPADITQEWWKPQKSCWAMEVSASSPVQLIPLAPPDSPVNRQEDKNSWGCD